MIELNHCQLHYEVTGTGIPILFVHPPLIASMTFAQQVNELSKTLMTITFDIRGHGKSDSSPQPLTYALVADDMRRLLDHLQIDNAYLCGYSTGGSIVLEFLLSYPDRARGSILIGAISEVQDFRLKMLINMAATFAKWGAFQPLALYISWSNANSLRSFWKSFQEARKGTSKNIAEYYRFSLDYNCTSMLQQIQNPVLLVYGEKDKGFYAYAQLTHRCLPNDQVVFIPNAKHQIPTKSAHELNRLIRNFIDSLEPYPLIPYDQP